MKREPNPIVSRNRNQRIQLVQNRSRPEKRKAAMTPASPIAAVVFNRFTVILLQLTIDDWKSQYCRRWFFKPSIVNLKSSIILVCLHPSHSLPSAAPEHNEWQPSARSQTGPRNMQASHFSRS